MKFIVKVFVLSIFVAHVFGSHYEVTVHKIDNKYWLNAKEYSIVIGAQKDYRYIQFQKKSEDSSEDFKVKQDGERPQRFALGSLCKEDNPLYIEFTNRFQKEYRISLGSCGIQLLYDQFQNNEKYCILQFKLKDKIAPILQCVLENKDNNITINDHWAKIKQIAFLFSENVGNIPKIKFFKNAATKTQLEATMYNKWDTIDNKLNLQITMHCLYEKKESAFELSEAAIEECCKMIDDIQEHTHNESKPKSLYFSINGISYKFEIDTRQISSIKEYYEEYYKDKKVDSPKVDIPTQVPVEKTKNSENNLKPIILAIFFRKRPQGFSEEGVNCALREEGANHIIIVGPGKSDIFVSLMPNDKTAILSLSKPFYLLVGESSYLINQVDNKILPIEKNNNEETKPNQNDQIPKKDQEVLKPIESKFLKLNNFKNLAIFGAGSISCIMIFSILLYFYKKQ